MGQTLLFAIGFALAVCQVTITANAQTPQNETAAFIAKAKSLEGSTLSVDEIQDLFVGNTLTYNPGRLASNLYIYYQNEKERTIDHPKRGRFVRGWSVKEKGVYCHKGFKGGQACRNNLRVSVKDDDVNILMVRMTGNKGSVIEGTLLPGNQLPK